MDKSLIQKHNFEAAKSNIEEFSKNLPANPSFQRVEVDGGLFGWGDHKVTGYEMNKFMGSVQDKLIDVNSSLRGIIGEFKEVYKALDALDNEYISGILKSIEEAEDASNQALSAQKDVDVTVRNLKKTVEGLIHLKESVSELSESVDDLQKQKRIEDKVMRRNKTCFIVSIVAIVITLVNVALLFSKIL